jgi:hypothetical protein
MTWLGRVVRLLPILPLSILCASCPGFFPSNGSVQSVAVTPTAVILSTPGGTSTLSWTSTSVGGTTTTDPSGTTWSSSPTGVVTVAAGVITAVGSTPGTTQITATDGGVASNACNVMTYTGTAPLNLLVTAPANLVTTAAAPGTYQFHAYFGAAGSPDVTTYVTWSSNPTTAATVDATTGLVTVLSIATPTTVTITATATIGVPAGTTQAPVTGSLEFTAD